MMCYRRQQAGPTSKHTVRRAIAVAHGTVGDWCCVQCDTFFHFPCLSAGGAVPLLASMVCACPAHTEALLTSPQCKAIRQLNAQYLTCEVCKTIGDVRYTNLVAHMHLSPLIVDHSKPVLHSVWPEGARSMHEHVEHESKRA